MKPPGNPFNTIRSLLSDKNLHGRHFAWCIVGLFAFSIFYSVALLCIPAVQHFAMGRFHLKPRPFAAWAALQIVPTMYSFENSTEYSTEHRTSRECPIRDLNQEASTMFVTQSCVRVASPHFFWGYPFQELFAGLASEQQSIRVDQISTFHGQEQRSTLWLMLGNKQNLRGRLTTNQKSFHEF